VKRHPKILFLVTEDWYFCSHRLPIACAARDAGFDVVVATRVNEQGDRIREKGLRLIPLDLKRGDKNVLAGLKAVAKLIRLYRSERPDIVHHVAMKPILYGSLAARIAHIPSTINAFAGMGYLFISSGLQARALRVFIVPAFRFILNIPRSRLIIQNPDDCRLLESLGIADRTRIVSIRGSGVDTDRFAPTPEPEGTPVVIMASRMLWDKGVGEFVGASRQLREREIPSRFVLVGQDDPENPSSIPPSRLREWHEQGLVEWWGHRDDMPEVFSRAHVVCLPSYREGLPKVLLEAASSGRPLVATDVPGCREIVRHGVNGLLVPARDAGALAAAIQQLLENPALRLKMGARGREMAVQEFSVEKIIEETIKMYRELLSS
jgi:glycosyltransferase involved in cell wall biosynthesis